MTSRSSTTWSARRASTRQGTLLQTTGFNRPGFPGMGCWVSYGLGSMNDNLPTFVVLPDHRGLASNGTKNWDSAFLPAQHQGTVIYPGIEDPGRRPVPGRAGQVPRRGPATPPASTCWADSTASTPRRRPGDDRLDARIRSYELAARMQLAAPEALDFSKEPKEVLKLYGLDHGKSSFDKEINAARGDGRTSAASAWPPAGCSSAASGSCRSGAATTTASRGGTGTATRT